MLASAQTIELPEPDFDGEVSVEDALRRRRSRREFAEKELALADVSQLLWAAQGVTNRLGFRTAPSAGALYPLEAYVITGRVAGLAPGAYKYRPRAHELALVREGDGRKALAGAALAQESIALAPASLVFCAVYRRTTGKYGERGIRYAHMEVGHAAQNVYLQATALGLGTVVIGAFRDAEVSRLIDGPSAECPLAIMPIGGW